MALALPHGALRWFAAVLALGLAGCMGSGSARLASQPARPDPPPIPLRKPAPPAVVQAPGPAAPAAVRVEARALAPARVASLASDSRPGPETSGPPVGTVSYRVRPGDTLFGVARRFAVPVRGVIDANRLAPPYALRVGQILRIAKPRRHVVQAGDTLYSVARLHGVEVSGLVRLNAIGPPYTILPGQALLLPTAGRAVATAPPGAIARQVAALRTAAPSGAGAAPRPGATPAPIKRANAVILRPPPRAGGKFLWPVRGRLIAGYGRKQDSRHNDGINIAAPRGAPVRAAENGVVAYVGNELRGFGNLLLIKHAGGWMTAYAHNESFLVARGDAVKRGQVIARIGSSGNVSRPQLHFEIRKGTQSVDPTRLLGAQKASTD